MGTVLIVRVLLIVMACLGIWMVIRIQKFIRLEKRISRYSLNEDQSIELSLLDRIVFWYRTFTSKFIENKKLKKYATSYERYISVGENKSPVVFILNKLLIGFLFVLLIVVSYTIEGKVFSFFGIIFTFIIGYYLYDVYLVYRKRRDKKKIKNEMLKAVIIMNNAFKAGKSTLQAVEIASHDLPTPISYEFQKIYHDMSYGLSVDVAFERFARRVDLPEAKYISSSLTILNKTGGNIVNVFSSIERTLFDKKKLESDLQNSTAASNFVVKFLMVIPIIFILIIYMVSPDYFTPFFNSILGYFLLGIMVMMFVTFVYLLNKIMKVRV